MKKSIIGILLILLFMVCPLSAQATCYKVLRVLDGDTFIVDFNSNGVADSDERVRLNGIDTFEVKNSSILRKQAEKFNITIEQALKLGYLGKKFAEDNLLNKDVKVEYSGRSNHDYYGRELVSIYYNCNKKGKCKSYENAPSWSYWLINFSKSRPSIITVSKRSWIYKRFCKRNNYRFRLCELLNCPRH